MKSSLLSRLERHFVAMSAVAAGAAVLTGAAPEARAQVVYSGVVNIPIPADFYGLYLDVVTGQAGGTSAAAPGFDMEFWGTTGAGLWFAASVPEGGGVASSAGSTSVLALAVGTPIDASSFFSPRTGNSTSAFSNTEARIMGFRFVRELDNTVHYGWVRWKKAGGAGLPGEVVDYAYESTPNTLILAGATTGGTPTGACCHADGTCTANVTFAACNAAGDVFNGAASCALANCPQAGACCSTTGVCTSVVPLVCLSGGGIYGGDGISCASVTCPARIENFANIAALTGDSWFMQNNSEPLGTTAWFQGDPGWFPAHSGAANAYISADYHTATGAGTISLWLGTPSQTFSNGDSVTFHARSWDAFADRLQVRFSGAGASTNVGTTATDVGDFTTLLLDINPFYQHPGTFPNVWTPHTVTIAGLGGPTAGRVAFRYFVEDGGTSGTNSMLIGIDTVYITSSAPACYANCDASTAAPVLNVADFTCFLTRYAANDGYANCDASTAAPTLNVADFTCFLTSYAAGCP